MAAAMAASPRDPSGDWQDFSGFQPPGEEGGGAPEAESREEGGSWEEKDLAAKLPLCFQPQETATLTLTPGCAEGDGRMPAPLPSPLSEQSALRGDDFPPFLETLHGLMAADGLTKSHRDVLANKLVKCVLDNAVVRIWNALTDNYGNVLPVDWKSSHTRTLHLPTLNLSEKGVNENLNLDLSDDEELREQLDMHSIIVSCINEEPLFTAEQVIEEIEEMMQESPDPDDDETPSQSDRLSLLSQEIQTLKKSSTNHNYEERVKKLSVTELNDLLEEIETAIKDYSEVLVQQLALRDELEFEKEVKNSFISILIEVQNKQREQKEIAKKKKKLKNGSPQNGKQEKGHMPGTRFSMEGISNVIQNGFRQTFGNSGAEKQYLTTVIPYEKKSGPPSVEDLQTLTKILCPT
ncbi:fasciculation and elongation protein zeta-2 isoform X2 [Sceloporus undulatus]|uniref:fasciculation and elongation protein zeta-2 isoform X2 n=1 Tax=Sceloporus undulatus TaxID=8520 RepID=UPI001C4D11A9|nr:fasciculation and elongation protein zeta-2 isoform X2 [Sceloporus undulatus]